MDAIVPPSLGDVPAGLREDLRSLQTLGDNALWAVARSRLASTQRARLEVLMARHSAGTLTEAEEEELARLGEETDRLILLKAHSISSKWFIKQHSSVPG